MLKVKYTETENGRETARTVKTIKTKEEVMKEVYYFLKTTFGEFEELSEGLFKNVYVLEGPYAKYERMNNWLAVEDRDGIGYWTDDGDFVSETITTRKWEIIGS